MSQVHHHDPVQRLNEKHADDLLAAARAFGGYPDATSARAERLDRAGIDLALTTPNGPTHARVDFREPAAEAGRGLRAAFADLTQRARAALAAHNSESRT